MYVNVSFTENDFQLDFVFWFSQEIETIISCSFRKMENSSENNSLNRFDVHGDVKSIGVRWEKWKRSFQIYIEAFNVKNAKVQKARLLHFTGADVQEIFYTLAELSDGVQGRNEFDEALVKLDKYFEPRQS